MNDPNQEFESALAEVSRAVKHLDSRGSVPSVPQYTQYDGLRAVEDSSAGSEKKTRRATEAV
jgi:hypothetical protein